MRLYDAQYNRLVQYGNAPTPAYWARIWRQKRDILQALQINTSDPLIPRLTRRFIPVNKTHRPKILDGGCGLGQHIARLTRLGYNAYGIDNDKQTIDRVKAAAPTVNIILGDVRALPFSDNSFDGYWSIGVIEHWPEGYTNCAREMRRVIKHGGYLFLTFPHLSLLRRLKVRLGCYSADTGHESRPFYQYILDQNRVHDDFKQLGFGLVYKTSTGGLKGLKDEIAILRPPLQRLYDSPYRVNKAVKVTLSRLLDPLAGHSAVLVLQKK